MTLPVNIDATYADDPANPSRAAHQQHHDTIHAAVNGLAGTYAAKVATQTFTGTQTIQSASAASVALIAKGFASQTADLQQWQDSAAAVKARISNLGDAYLGGSFVSGGYLGARHSVIPGSAAEVGAIVRGFASQASDLQQWQNSSATQLAAVDSGGGVFATASYVGVRQTFATSSVTGTSSAIPVQGVRGAAAQTASLQQWQNSAAAVLARVDADGTISNSGQYDNTAGTGTYMVLIAANGAYFVGRAAAASAVVVRGASAQTGPLLSLQDSAGTTLASYTPAGLNKWDATANTQTTVGAAGGASALPATPKRYLKVVDNTGATLVIPAYLP